MAAFMDFWLLICTKEKCIQFLQEKNLLPKERTCICGTRMKLMLSEKRDRFRCIDKKCNKELSLKSGTWFEDCHLPLPIIVSFIYWWSEELTTIEFCKKQMKINSNHTIVDYNNFLREVCAWRLLQDPVVIGGPGYTVEIDESLVSRRKYNVGRMKKQTWVFGGICRETNECFIYVVPDRTKDTLESCIKASIKEGTTIISDCWKSYNGIPLMDMNYKHMTVNHSKNFVDPSTGACTNKVESMWNVAKMRFKRMWGVHEGMLDSYLCEYMYRKRFRGQDIFELILNDIACYQKSLSK